MITVDRDRRIIEDGAVAIDGGRILEVGSATDVAPRYQARHNLDARNMILIPGLVDLYGHGGASLLKCVGEHLGGATWRGMLDDVGFRFATPRWWYVDTLVHALERLKFGCTFALTQCGVSQARMDDPTYTKQVQRAFEDLGMRARIIAGIARAPWPQTYASYVDGVRSEKVVGHEECLDVIEEVVSNSKSSPSPLVDYCVGTSRIGNANPVDPVYVPEQSKYVRPQAERLRSIMERYDVGFWCHAYGDAIEFAHDQELGLLGRKSILSHCSGISRRSIEILATTGTSVNHCPRARRLVTYNQDCPVVELIDARVNVGLGSDGNYIDRSADPFLDLKAAIRLQQLRFVDSRVLPPGKALEMATIDACRALGLDSDLGSIEAGKMADIVLVDIFKPHLWPLRMPLHQLVYLATGADVAHVFINGEHVIDQGRSTRIDELSLLQEAEEELQRLMSLPDLRLKEYSATPGQLWGHSRRYDQQVDVAPRWRMPDRWTI